EGFKTLGIALKGRTRIYDAFPLAKPDDFLVLNDYKELRGHAEELIEKNVIIIPHGSMVEYLGIKEFESLPVPTFGNRRILKWESDRAMERVWLEGAGISMPKLFESPDDIDVPVLVKYDGARGGRGFFIARTPEEFWKGIDRSQKYTIQEYIIGTRYYLHYFYSPLIEDGYRLSRGSLQLLSIDRRDETNIDEMYKLGSQEHLKAQGIYPTFVVTGNVPVVIRESLMPEVMEMGEKVVERSLKLMGGMIGSFCLESVVTDRLEFKVFEMSARIVAGTNPFISGSPYSEFIMPGLSTGQRIAMEIKEGIKQDRLEEIIS
ncbi:MAG: formate--phosphoribosylaminoimidazolecarboxamide ligase, partial [Thermoplasmata archaeon]|nr:formate--phosphoribosylaminoimidazolecarboxamide ligase [Thermoplasmata archaeon]